MSDQYGTMSDLEGGPISMQAVGQEDLSDSLLGAIPARRVPPEAIMQLLQGPSQMQRIGQAAAGGVAFMRGQPNPVTPILEEQRRENIGLATMLFQMAKQDDMNAQRAVQNKRQQEQLILQQKRLQLDEQFKRDDLQLKIRAEDRHQDAQFFNVYNQLKDNPNPMVQGVWAKGMSQLLSKGGQQVPPEFLAQQLKIDEKELDQIRGAIEAGVTDEQITQQHPRLLTNPGYLQTERAVLQNPVMRAKLGYKTNEELRGIQYDLVTKKAKAWAIENGYKEDSPEFRAANQLFREKTGRSIYDSDPNSIADLQLLQQIRPMAKAMGDDEEFKKMVKQASLQREMADLNAKLAEARQDAKDRKKGDEPLSHSSWIDMQTNTLVTPTKDEWKADPKRYRKPNAAEETNLTLLVNVMPMVQQVKNLVDQLLVDNTPDNLVNALRGKGAKALRNSAGWAQLDALLLEQNVELARALGGSGQLRTTLLQMLQDTGIKTRDTREVAKTIADTIDTSVHNRRMSILSGGDPNALKAYPNPMQAPKNPETGKPLPAGVKMENGNMVSADGKFVWVRGKGWVPRNTVGVTE